MAPLTLDSFVTLLSSYDGRDKMLRTAYYALVIAASKSSHSLGPKLLDVAKQVSAARTVGRRFGDFIMLKANIAHFSKGPGSDLIQYLLNAAVNVLYQFYYPVEHVAWLSQLALLPADPAKWWTYTTKIWACALVLSMIKCVRSYFKLLKERRQYLLANDDNNRGNLKRITRQQIDEITTFIMLYSDFMNAINFLPKGFLWAQTFSSTKVGFYGFVASAIGLIKLFNRL